MGMGKESCIAIAAPELPHSDALGLRFEIVVWILAETLEIQALAGH
jgi:hypothetical protein